MYSLKICALAAATLSSLVNAQACDFSGGNWYCNQVRAISYLNFGTSGTYDRVTYMNDETGECKKSSAEYGGVIAPFNEDLSIHIRGPFSLKQFAFYTPGSPKARRGIEERALPTIRCPAQNQTTVTISGKTFRIECGINRRGNMGKFRVPSYAACIQKCAETTDCAQASWVPRTKLCFLKPTTAALRPQDFVRGIGGASLISDPIDEDVEERPNTQSPAAFTRRSYYNSKEQTKSGVTFLNNMGGGNYPGIWSSKFGNSLGYSSPSGLAPASSPQMLADTTLPSTSEISLFTDQACTDANPCPYVRPGSVAYHGFSGASKIFLFEFSMPHDPDSKGADMPALWFLNAQIPRTQQYGACSCWGNTNGCGELDAFEVLTKGEKRMITAVHGDQAATNPHYFQRPTTKTIKGAVVLVDGAAHIKLLADSFDFAEGLTQQVYNKLIATEPPHIAASRVATMALT